MINALVGASLNSDLIGNGNKLREIISNNGFEILALLASNRCTKMIYEFDTVSKALILKLIKVAAVANHPNAVKELMYVLSPK